VGQFNQIAQSTGGSVHETTKERIDEVMETLMEVRSGIVLNLIFLAVVLKSIFPSLFRKLCHLRT
jgi:hypothetical protein